MSLSRRSLFALPVALPVMAAAAATGAVTAHPPFVAGAYFESADDYYNLVRVIGAALDRMNAMNAQMDDNNALLSRLLVNS